MFLHRPLRGRSLGIVDNRSRTQFHDMALRIARLKGVPCRQRRTIIYCRQVRLMGLDSFSAKGRGVETRTCRLITRLVLRTSSRHRQRGRRNRSSDGANRHGTCNQF